MIGVIFLLAVFFLIVGTISQRRKQARYCCEHCDIRRGYGRHRR